MKARVVILLILFNLFFVNVNRVAAQEQKIDYPLYTFLQNTFDSAIVTYSISPWNHTHNYFIIAKKDKQVCLFTYTNPYENIFWVRYPDSLMKKYENEYINYSRTLPDTNRFFLPKILRRREVFIDSGWRNLVNTKLFSIKNDTADNRCIAKNGMVYDVYDDPKDYFIVITSREIKHLSFYAPSFYNEFCPNDNRTRILEAEKYF